MIASMVPGAGAGAAGTAAGATVGRWVGLGVGAGVGGTGVGVGSENCSSGSLMATTLLTLPASMSVVAAFVGCEATTTGAWRLVATMIGLMTRTARPMATPRSRVGNLK